ncbi:PARP-domain-containing protein [Mycena latifolia]|nr:PARP-domain-containing protein [Mycena latifolia]
MFAGLAPSSWRQITIWNRGIRCSRQVRNASTPTAPVDPLSGRKDTHRVYTTNEPWDVILNQTDIIEKRNKNKFYIIQLLQSTTNLDSYALYTRWGRVGEQGQIRLEDSFKSASAAEKTFNKKFKSKTGVEWTGRESATPLDGKYIWLDRDYEVDDENKEAGDGPSSTLVPEVQALCNVIFSQELINAHLAAMNYNVAKTPLGKLGKTTISKGFSALKRLADVIDDPKGTIAKKYGNADAAYATLSSVYYSIIPHVFGRFPLPVINTPSILKQIPPSIPLNPSILTSFQELDLMDSLVDMSVASSIMKAPARNSRVQVHPMDQRFLSLGLSSISPVPPDSPEFQAIAKYSRDTEVRSSSFELDIAHLFKVERGGETDAWKSAGHDQLHGGERLLLWHGSRSTNFAGILKNVLRIAPPEAPSSGYMFGRGVYFADMVSKSFNYCHTYLSDGAGLMLLCEVAAAPFFEQKDANSCADVDCAKAQQRSTKGLGRSAPASWTDAGAALRNEELRGCMMPAGPKRLRTSQPALNHNEYIVYNLNQIRLRYVVIVKVKDKPKV